MKARPNPSIERTSFGKLPLPTVAAHVDYKGFPSRSSHKWTLTCHVVMRSSESGKVRTAGLQPVIVQRSLLRTLMEDARRGSIR